MGRTTQQFELDLVLFGDGAERLERDSRQRCHQAAKAGRGSVTAPAAGKFIGALRSVRPGSWMYEGPR